MVPHPYTDKDADRWLTMVEENWATGLGHTFAITHNGRMIGSITVDRTPEAGAYELGYWLGSGFWGQGFAIEAARKLVEVAWEELPLAHLVATHHEENEASARLLAKLGFREVGRERRWRAAKNDYIPTILLKLERAEISAKTA